MHFHFDLFTLEGPSPSCLYDGLRIYDGPSVDFGQLLGTWCGNDAPVDVFSCSNYALLEFYSDASVNAGGFEVLFEQYDLTGEDCGCGGAFIDAEIGTLSSPNYPAGYPAQSECFWTISVQPGFVLSLAFDAVQLENVNN